MNNLYNFWATKIEMHVSSLSTSFQGITEVLEQQNI